MNSKDSISLKLIFKRYKTKLLFTWSLVFIETGVWVLFPFVLGLAIDDLIQGNYDGLIYLCGIGLFSLIIGAGRRFYDTRIYAEIYSTISPELVEREREKGSEVSVISARTSLLTEFVEFLENSFPEMIDSFFGLVGAIVMISFLNTKVFLACLAATALIMIVYGLTSKRTYNFNSKYNEELEKQVNVLSENKKKNIVSHFKNIMTWNIKLSDLETMNFSLSWLFLLSVLMYSVVVTVKSGLSSHGEILAILMYVFDYIESVLFLPLYYQQYLRLKEITNRLQGN